MSLQDYARRPYDFLALQDISYGRDAKLRLELFDATTSGKICVGAQKLVQRWLLEFFTETGSLIGRPTRGCDFMLSVRQNLLRTAADVRLTFAGAITDIGRNLREEEYEEMNADERFSSAELLNVAILAGYLNLSVKINSLAGASRAIIVPVATLP